MKFTVGNTIIQNVVALLFAVALDSGIKAQKVYRTIFFIPCLISAVIVGFIWLKMFSNVLPAINDLLGTHFNFLLFGEKSTVLRGLLIANNWQWIGYWMLIYLAGLQSVPAELYEAATIDGAGRFGRLWHVTLPAIKGTIIVMLILRVGRFMDTGFEQIFLMLNVMNRSVGEVFDTYIYDQGVLQGKFSYAMAVTVFKSVLNFVLVMLTDRLAKRFGEEGIL